jgi:hypothetical protein
MSNPFFYPPSGLLCVRKTGDGFITMGVLHFPEAFRPEEGTAYPMMLDEHGMLALPSAMGRLDKETLDSGMTYWPTQKCWPRFEGGIAARFLNAFPSGNGWSAMMVTKADPFEKHLSEQHRSDAHYWVRVHDGVVLPADSPVPVGSLNGVDVGGIYRDRCVWPDHHGKPSTLPIHTLASREMMHLGSLLQALVAKGDLDQSVFISLGRRSVALRRELGLGTPEPEFQKFRVAAYDAYLIEVERPRNEEQNLRYKEKFAQVFAQSMDADELPVKNAVTSAPSPH